MDLFVHELSSQTYGRDIGKVARTEDTALVTVPQLQEALGRKKDIVCFGVPVEAWRIC